MVGVEGGGFSVISDMVGVEDSSGDSWSVQVEVVGVGRWC